MACAQLLPLCDVGVPVSREGQVGAYAYENVFPLGPYYFSGAQVNDPSAVIPQNADRTSIGTIKPNTFVKGYATISEGACPVPPQVA